MNARPPRPGDVLAIPLAAIGRTAYARVYEEQAIAVYARLAEYGETPPIGGRLFLFQVGVFAQALRDPAWPRVGRDPFVAGEDPWPVPRFVRDAIDGSFGIYADGVLHPSSEAQVSGWEPASAWTREHIEDRLLALWRDEQCSWLAAQWPVDWLDLGVPGVISRRRPEHLAHLHGASR